MATQYVPDDIRDFILKHIVSVAQIEALLLIWASPEEAKSLVEAPGEVDAIDRVARGIAPR